MNNTYFVFNINSVLCIQKEVVQHTPPLSSTAQSRLPATQLNYCLPAWPGLPAGVAQHYLPVTVQPTSKLPDTALITTLLCFLQTDHYKLYT